MFILNLFVLQALSGSFCFDVELKGNVKLGNQILNALKKPSGIIDQVLNAIPIDISGKGDLSQVLPESVDPMIKRAMKAFNNRQANWDIIRANEVDKTTDPLKEFMDHLQKKGTKTLENIATQIIIDLNIKKNITPILQIVTDDYTKTLQNYYEFVKKNQHDIKRDFVYLDVVETSCRLLYNEEKKLLNDIIMHETNHDQGDNFQRLAHKLLQLSKKDRMDVMEYLCKTYKVCREYPAFTDYFADLISEVFILDDKRFRIIVEILAKILKKKEKIFAKITEKKDRELITEKLRSFLHDTFAMRELLGVMRVLIKHRFKTIQSGNEDFKAKTKATSIILDIIDKALYSDDDLLAIDFDNSVLAIRSWSADKRHDIDKHLEEFARSFLRRFEYNLTENARNELQALIKILVRGTTENDKFAARLLKSGSTYVNGEDFHPDIDVLSI